MSRIVLKLHPSVKEAIKSCVRPNSFNNPFILNVYNTPELNEEDHNKIVERSVFNDFMNPCEDNSRLQYIHQYITNKSLLNSILSVRKEFFENGAEINYKTYESQGLRIFPQGKIGTYNFIPIIVSHAEWSTYNTDKYKNKMLNYLFISGSLNGIGISIGQDKLIPFTTIYFQCY